MARTDSAKRKVTVKKRSVSRNSKKKIPLTVGDLKEDSKRSTIVHKCHSGVNSKSKSKSKKKKVVRKPVTAEQTLTFNQGDTLQDLP